MIEESVIDCHRGNGVKILSSTVTTSDTGIGVTISFFGWGVEEWAVSDKKIKNLNHHIIYITK
jgi:hypothetical protein